MKQAGSLILVGITTMGLAHFSGKPALARSATITIADEQPQTGDDCLPIPGWNAIAKQAPKYVVFGELHGTRESPAFVAALACNLAAAGKNILVAVEIDSTADAILQNAWQSSPAEFKAAVLRAGWADRKDGVASVALLDMLTRLHALKSQGRRISVVAFRGDKGAEQRARFSGLAGQAPLEAASAENINDAFAAGRFDLALVLVGNIHARRTRVIRGDTQFQPMAAYLAEFGKVVSLNMATSGGTGWGCAMKPGMRPGPDGKVTSDMLSCGAHPIAGAAGTDGMRIGLGHATGQLDDPSYDGFYWVGSITSSPPIFP